MPDLTETSVRSEHLLDGKLLQVYRDDVRLPNGETSIREWIRHPGASAVVPLFEDGRTLLVRQFRFPPRRQFLEVPAGKIDIEGEDPEGVARRELEEETGWRAERFTKLGATYPCIGYSNEVIHFYLAEGLTEGTRDLEHGEFVENVFLPFEEAVTRAQQGELYDMKTAAAIFYADAYLRRRAAETENGTATP